MVLTRLGGNKLIKLRKYISFLLVVALICSILPTYAGATSNDPIENNKQTLEDDIGNLEEVVEDRTADSKTYSNGEGSFVKEIYPEEIHNKVGKKYEDISEDLVKNSKGNLETEATNLQAEFPQKASESAPIVYTSGEHQLSFKLSYATDGENKSKPSNTSVTEKSENNLTYKSIYKDIDLRHIALNKEVKEDWIMNEYNGINEFHYDIQTDLYGQLEKDGSVAFYETDSKEEKVFELPKPVMVDSNYNDTLGDGVRSSDIKYELTKKSDGGYELALVANKEWLASSKRVFPIYIDPSVSIDALGDTFVMSAYPKNNYNKEWDSSQGEYVLKTGYYDSTTGTNYSFIKFPGVDDLKGATIDSAELSAYVTHSYYATTKNGLWVDEVNAKWYADELIWNNKPSSTKITSTTVARDEWAKFNVQSTIQAWVSGERSNYGFKFHTNGNGKTYWKKITAAESANKAKIVIAYHYDQMATPTMTATSDGVDSGTGSVNVKWKAVNGATGYDLQMFDGKTYQSIYQGTALSWSSKGLKVFPKSPYKTTSVYSTTKAGVELPLDPTGYYSVKAGATVTSKAYKFRVIPKYTTGNGPTSATVSKAIPVPAGEPDLPTVTAKNYAETDATNTGRGWLEIKWNKVVGATGYKVGIWNGKKYEYFTVGKDTVSISTKGKKIWPTDAEIKSGTTDLHQVDFDKTTSIGTGVELPIDPSTTYGNSTRRYSVVVKAMSAAGDSPASDVNYGYMPTYAPKNVTIKSNEDNLVQNKTSLSLSWDATVGARFYDIILSDGKTEETITVRGKTSYTSLPKYDLEKTYTATVQAYVFDDDSEPESEEDKINGKRGESPLSIKVSVKPDMHEELIGLEDYFTYENQDFGNASASVNVTTGNMVLQFTDESLYTRSDLGYSFIRSYNSRSTKNSVLGKGWTFKGNESLTILENGDAFFTDEDGTVHLFKKDGNQFISPKGLYEKLEKVNNTTYTMTDKNQFVQTYKIGQKSTDFFITSYSDKYDNKIDFERNDTDQLISVSETKGIEKQEKIHILYKDNKINKVQYADHWTVFEYTGDLLTQTTIGSDKTERRIVENFTYNGQGQMDKYIDGKKNNTIFSYKENEFSIFDQQEAEATDDELSVTSKYTFNDKENVYKSIAGDDSESVYNRDLENNTFAVSQKKENSTDTTIYKLDTQYNIVKLTNSDGTTVQNEYDARGNLLTSISSEGTVVNKFNDKNQLIESIETSGEVTTNKYEGNTLSSTVKDETTIDTFDSYGRVIKTDYPNKTFDVTKYDDDLYTVTSTDKKGNLTKESYTVYGQIKEVSDADGKTTKYTYDPLYADTLTSVTDGNGNKTSYEYDDNNNMSSLTDARENVKSYMYNDNDQVTNVAMPGMTFQYEYDINGEMSKMILPSGFSTEFHYTKDDQIDNVQVMNKLGKSVNTTQYEYDDLGNVTRVLQDEQLIKEYGYTTETNLLEKYKMRLFTQNYVYDDKERITDRTTLYNNAFTIKEQMKYKENSDNIDHLKYELNDNILHEYQYNQKTADNQNIITLNSDLLKKVSQFNDSNLLESLTYTSKSQLPFEIEYGYTKNGSILNEKVQGESTTFEYDGNKQLTKETFENGMSNSYKYDSVGNRVEASVNGVFFRLTYNDDNQIQTKNDLVYQYDIDGNLIQDENFKYSYNEAQQLIAVQTVKGEKVADYTYDENGLRLTKTVGTTTYEYFYNDGVLNMEIAKENGIEVSSRYYEWNGNIPLGMIVKENEAEKAYHFITNHRGDVLNIRDENDKEVGSYNYDSYGNILEVEGVIAKNNMIRYAGYYYDEETANYYLQARYYNSENGAFLALDPHPGDDDLPLTQNGYNYAGNNPLNFTDHTGHKMASIFTYVKAVAFFKFLQIMVKDSISIAFKKLFKKKKKNNYKLDLQYFSASNTKGISKKLLDGDTIKLNKFKDGKYKRWTIEKDKGKNTGGGTHGGSEWKLKHPDFKNRYWSITKEGKILRVRNT